MATVLGFLAAGTRFASEWWEKARATPLGEPLISLGAAEYPHFVEAG